VATAPLTVTYRTENSRYEVRRGDPFIQVRRVEGVFASTPRLEGGEWKDAIWIGIHERRLLIYWGDDPSGELRNCTLTSPIVDVTINR